jgi:transposase-like protein
LNNYINNNTSFKNITDIIKRNENGVYEWIDEIRDEINNDILNYFATRQDDEIPNVNND